MATYFGAPSRSSIAIFAGPVAQERVALGAAKGDYGLVSQGNALLNQAASGPAGSNAAAGSFDWNAIGGAVTGIAQGVNQWLQQIQKPPGSASVVGPGASGPVTGQTPYIQPTIDLQVPQASSKSDVPQWAIAAAVALALALAGWAVLGKRSRRRR